MEESAEQVRGQRVRDMGPDLGAVFNELWDDIAWLHAKWNLYRQLYARSPERIAFLNKVASHFFGVVQDTLYEDVLLNLARLTDPPQSGPGRDNLTLRSLPQLIADPALCSEMKRLVEAARRACEAPRAWRHRHIAHRDLKLALASTSDPIPGAPSRAEIEAALHAIRAVLHRIEAHYRQPETAYQYVIPAGGDADALVHYLREGFRAEEQQMERFLQGEPALEDPEPQDEI